MTIFNSTIFPYNDVYYSEHYNGFGNLTSVFKAPLYASKPYYFQCDNADSEQPIITKVSYVHKNSSDVDDMKLLNESWADIEPISGAVVRAAQKILISALLVEDELFENSNKFVPIYYIFRTGNFSEIGVKEILGVLVIGLQAKNIIEVLGICLIMTFVSLLIFSFIKKKLEKNERQTEGPFLQKLNKTEFLRNN